MVSVNRPLLFCRLSKPNTILLFLAKERLANILKCQCWPIKNRTYNAKTFFGNYKFNMISYFFSNQNFIVKFIYISTISQIIRRCIFVGGFSDCGLNLSKYFLSVGWLSMSMSWILILSLRESQSNLWQSALWFWIASLWR